MVWQARPIWFRRCSFEGIPRSFFLFPRVLFDRCFLVNDDCPGSLNTFSQLVPRLLDFFSPLIFLGGLPVEKYVVPIKQLAPTFVFFLRFHSSFPPASPSQADFLVGFFPLPDRPNLLPPPVRNR